ncbi:MAG: cell wall hydrolase [Novosphingobium sp.]|nr:cell wall hydrolase [Novosphingobium sp.]
MGFETAGESFPGSAFYYLADDPYTPLAIASDESRQKTGNALDSNAHWDSDAKSPATATPASPTSQPALAYIGPAARPLLAAQTGIDRLRAVDCLTQAIYYEAASESDAGQRAVAQVVLNRVLHPAYPDTVCGVVYQGSTRQTGCQFTFTCDGSLARKPSRFGWDRARGVALAALGGAVYAPIGLATHYHTLAVSPYWASSLDKVRTIGAHVFYRWKGAAGRPAAFHASYSGGEPGVAGLGRFASAKATTATSPVVVEAGLTVASAPAQSVGSTPPSPAVERADSANNRLPGGGTVRKEYARSGEWIMQR